MNLVAQSRVDRRAQMDPVLESRLNHERVVADSRRLAQERDGLIVQRDAIAAERDLLRAERDRLNSQLAKAQARLDRVLCFGRVA
jgi:uncharacterized coiled-coil DUF342 family protein